MYVERIKKLAKEQGKTITYICSLVGRPKYYLNDLTKTGADMPPEYLTTIANDLNTTVDYLLGKTDARTVPDKKLEGLDFALSGEIKTLTENEKQDLLDYIRFKKQQKEERDK